MAKLDKKIALVTGASRGIGAAIARRLAADGASVVLNYAKGAAAAESIVNELTAAGNKAIAIAADLRDPSAIKALVDAAVKKFGRIDILVNNAGWAEFNRPLETLDTGHYDRQMDLNVRGLLLTTQATLPHMPDGGRVINIGSGITHMPTPGSIVYSITKAAVEMATKVLAKELGPRKITVNCVAPGTTDTELLQGSMGPDVLPAIIAMTPLGRLGRVEDIADVVAFVASDEARWITGDVISASGGL